MTASARIWVGVGVALLAWTLAALCAYRTCLGPYLACRRSQDWEPVACTVERATASFGADDGTMWAFDLVFAYERGGVRYRGTRYSFWNEVVSRSPAEFPRVSPGPAICFVDPRDPRTAVLSRGLDRGFRPVAIGVGIAFALATLIACTAIVGAVRKKPSHRSR